MRDSQGSASGLPDSIEKCINALEKARNDTEKIAALFLIPKVIKDVDCTAAARVKLMEAIGLTFLSRMLRSPAGPEGCPPHMYQSVALTILSCFTGDLQIITHPAFLINVPQLLEILGDTEENEENGYIVKDAYNCLVAIVSTEDGKEAVMKDQGVEKLCEISCAKMRFNDDALKLLENLLSTEGSKCWDYPSSSTHFDILMTKLCQSFSNVRDENKFEMCDTIRTVLRSYPLKDCTESPWMVLLVSELSDILLSKIGKSQRDPTIKLLAAVTELSNFDWCQCDEERGVGSGHFLFVATNLATIELVMQFEDCSLDELMDCSDLLISCYFIIESASAYISSHSDLVIERKYMEKLQVAFRNGFGVILHLLKDVLNEQGHFEDVKKKHFIYATVKVVCAWLAEETMALREDVIEILPKICTLVTESFSARKASTLDTEKHNNFADLLRFLLPGLCHLIVEDKPRKILLEMKMQETLYDYSCYHWRIYTSYQISSNEGDTSQAEVGNSKDAMTTICGIVMNLVVLEPKLVNRHHVFENFLEFSMERFNTEKHTSKNMTFMANLAILGLLILEKKKTESLDEKVAKFISEVGQFLEEAHSYEGSSLKFEISAAYADHWEEMGDLWLLGVQSLSNILEINVCYKPPIVELCWTQKIVKALCRISPSGIDANSVSALESLLVQLLQEECRDIKDTGDMVSICKKHQMNNLLKRISSSLK